jgi:hypothetical protein
VVRPDEPLLDYVETFLRAYAPLRIARHDEFYSADGTRGCFQFAFHWHSQAPFYGNEPTGERGMMVEPTSSLSAPAASSSSG